MHAPRPRLVLVDDHALVRRGLAMLLRIDARYEVVAEARSGEDALEVIAREHPDLVLLDLNLPGIDGLETLRRLRAQGRTCRVLIVSMHDEHHLVGEALRNGADGYLLKDSMDEELFHAIEVLLRGQRYLAKAIDRSRVVTAANKGNAPTAREYEVLQLIAAGLTTGEVAVRLRISPHTATRHRANLMHKLEAHNQVELLRNASRRGFLVLGHGAAPHGAAAENALLSTTR
ncbi:MAG: response regulator transcription factor [Gemmatimonadetes bacterium]|nr:response regulator transcription factor [Gemmatimonadota bacterium]